MIKRCQCHTIHFSITLKIPGFIFSVEKKYEEKKAFKCLQLFIPVILQMDLQERLKVVEEDVSHKKNHIDSIRRQLQACTKEKSKYEMMYNKAREEIEKRVRTIYCSQKKMYYF